MGWRLSTLIIAGLALAASGQSGQSESLVDLVEDVDFKPPSIVYYVTAPKTVRQFRPYPVSITIQNASAAVEVNVELVRKPPHRWGYVPPELQVPQESEKIVAETKTTVQPGKTARVALKIESLTRDSYALRVRGQDLRGNNFTDESVISVERRNNLIFIQTDKPVYKLGDTVRFRIIALDTALRPVSVPLTIKINDPQGNLIQQHLQVNSGKDGEQLGYFAGDLQLASEAPLGEWSIDVSSSEEDRTSKRVSVEEYVLPRFNVDLKTPEYIIAKQDTFEITLTANYTFGEPVKGSAIIQVDGPGRWVYELRRDVRLSKNFTIQDFNGVAKVKVFIADILNRTEDFSDWNSISIRANVTEGTTKVTREASAKSVSMKKQPYKLNIIKSANTFKPGFPYTITVVAVQHDNRPIPPTAKKMIVKVSSSAGAFSRAYFDEVLNSYIVPVNGTVEVTFTPAKETRNIFFSARLGKVSTSTSIGGFDSPSNSFMQISPVNKDKVLTVGDTASFSVLLTNPFDVLNYTILSKSQILSEGTVPAKDLAAKVEFKTTKEMTPRARMLVYYIRPDSEVVANVIDFEVSGLLQNNVTLSVKPESGHDFAEPGSQAVVRVETSPNSFVGLLAMDQSLLLLKTGNDISETDVISSASSFDTDTWAFDNAFGSSRFKLPDGRSVYSFLQQAGLLVLSNADIPGNPKRQISTDDSDMVSYGMAGPQMAFAAPAMAMAETGGARGGSAKRPGAAQQTEPRLRKDFSETFLYETLTVGSNGSAEFRRNVPDTITSWVSSAFSLNKELGLGLTKDVPKLRVFRPFFAVLNLPFSIVRGELINLEVLVFNYLGQNQNVSVTLSIRGQDVNGKPISSEPREKFIMVKSQDSSSLTFPVKPELVGTITILATAKCDLAGDSLEKNLMVKPEGLRQQFNAPFFVDLRKENAYESELLIPLPQADIVPGSEKLVFSAIGDLVGPTISNIDRLIQLPSGCGEQNMALLAPNVFVMKYLASTGRLTDELKEKLTRNMRQGYQRQLVFKHHDRSYSAFGDSDVSGSTFLTAFVARIFNQAKDFVTIDENIITGALDWLVQQQAENGSFPEVGKVFDRELQGGAGKGTALTAYVLITLVESQSLGNYSANIANATRFLEGQYKAVNDDPYALSIVNYALQLSGSKSHSLTSNRLDSLAVIANGTKHWEKEREVETQTFGKFIWEYKLPAKDIEMTAYGLLSAIRRKDIDGGFPILAWLLSKRNQQGGFQTSQDTVVGLQAISEFAQLTTSKDRKIDVQIKSDGVQKGFAIGDENALVLQNAEPGKFSQQVHVSATGKGTALVQVSWIYYVRNTTGKAFSLTTTVRKGKTSISINACSKYHQNASDMAVMEINMPSGYQVDDEEVKQLTAVVPDLQRVDIEDSSTKVILYFDKFTKEQTCVTITGFRLFNVDNLQDSNVVVFNYYKPDERDTAFFNAK